MKPLDRFVDIAYEGAITDTLRVCSRWAPKRLTVQGVPFSVDAYPYVRGILDSRARFNWVRKGAQVGLSTAAMAIAFFEVDFHEKDLIYYFPTKAMAEEFSKGRIADIVNESTYLKRIVSENSVTQKKIGNRTMYIKGANSEVQRKGTSAARLFIDELDEWPRLHIEQVKARLHGQRRKDTICWGFSTPKLPDQGIDYYYRRSTKEVFKFNCPHCREAIHLDPVDNLFIVEDCVEDSYIFCHLCGGILPYEEESDTPKPWLTGGWWEATNPDVDPALSRSFYVPQIYSPSRSPEDLAVSYLDAQHDPDARREYYNSVCGLPYVEDAHQVRDEHIDAAMRSYRLTDTDTRPTRATEGIFTLGIDQGGDLHHWVAVKWLFDMSRVGDPNDRAIGRVVGMGRIPQGDWDAVHGLMRAYQVRMAVIDYYPEPTNARIFARKFPGVVYLCQYVTGTSGREVRIQEDDYGASIVKVDRTSWLTKSLGRVMSGDMELPADIPYEFREHIKAPVRTLSRVKGQYVASYDEGDREDHYAHALNYSEIALKVLDPGLHSGSIIKSVRNNP